MVYVVCKLTTGLIDRTCISLPQHNIVLEVFHPVSCSVVPWLPFRYSQARDDYHTMEAVPNDHNSVRMNTISISSYRFYFEPT